MEKISRLKSLTDLNKRCGEKNQMAISSFTTRDCLQELGYRIAECRAVEQYIYEKQDESTLIGFKMLHCTSAFFVKYFVDDRKALFLKKTFLFP